MINQEQINGAVRRINKYMDCAPHDYPDKPERTETDNVGQPVEIKHCTRCGIEGRRVIGGQGWPKKGKG